MNIGKILFELGIRSSYTYERIQGGQASKVFKVSVSDGSTFALRLIPSNCFEQFIHEQRMMKLAKDNGITVPDVYVIKVIGHHAAMLLEWLEGKTLFHILQEQPNDAKKLGFTFGKVQASIHQISPPDMIEIHSDWLSPVGKEEKEVLQAIRQSTANDKKVLLHLDFHPLNILVHSTTISVIDWCNASFGDYRFDYARTLTTLELEGRKYFQENMEVLDAFIEGYQEGFVSVIGPIESISLFMVWAGVRMKRDIQDRTTASDRQKIDDWIEDWL